MQDVIDLLDVAAKNYPMKALAPDIGKAESTLRNELTQQDGYKLGLITSYQILKLTKDYRALDRLEKLLGRVAFVLPRATATDMPTLMQLTGDLTREFGEHMTALGTGIEEESFPRKKWYNVPEPYPEPPESIGVPPHDYLRSPGAMSYSALELSNINRVTAIDRPLSAYLEDVKEIFESEETNIIAALSSNIVQFREMVRDRKEREIDRKNMIKMQKQIQKLTQQLKVEKNENDSSNNPGDNAENE